MTTDSSTSLCRLGALSRASESQLSGWTIEVSEMTHGGTASFAQWPQKFHPRSRSSFGYGLFRCL